MKALMQLLDDPKTFRAWRRQRRIDKAVWISTVCVSGAITGIGGLATIVGLADYGYDGNTSAIEAGAYPLVLGAAATGAGVTGLVLSKRHHDDPRTWYDEPSLRSAIDGYDQRLPPEAGVSPGAWLEIHPVIGPGMIGVAGTF
jgi:hypothetical protein